MKRNRFQNQAENKGGFYLIKEARGFGEDITEAQENALKNLGASLDEDVQFEIISQSKKKVLGIFGGSKAEVRAFINIPDAPVKKIKKEKVSPKKENKNKASVKPKEEKGKKTEMKPSVAASVDFKDAVDAGEIDKNSKTGRAITYLRNILDNLGCKDITIKAIEQDNGAYILLDGEGLGVVIGRRGETLDALQYLTSLAANDKSGYFKVFLNIGNYREKREIALTDLAKKVAEQVLSTGRSRALEPMNPYERRVIHTAIQEIDGVVSNSIGEGSNRRVVVYSENGDSKPPRIQNDTRRNQRRNRSSRQNNTVSSEPTREPKKDSDIPLYGKIN